MPKAYIVTTYRSISNPDALAEYAKLAGPAMIAAGGRFLARGNATKAYEKGLLQRVVILEFDNVEKAVAAHDGPGYQGRIEGVGQRRRARHSHRRSAGIISLSRNSQGRSPTRCSNEPPCLLLAQSRHHDHAEPCPLLGV